MTMRPVRDLWGEMVDRRLWPVALLLAIALVAVPVVLAKQPPAGEQTAAGAPPAASASAPDVAATPAVSVTQGAAADAPLRGAEKNPFKQQHVPARATGEGGTAPVDTGAGTGSAGTGGTSGSSGGSTGSGGSGGSGGDTGTTQPRTYVYASIDVRFGRAGAPLRSIRDVPRLTPLPNAAMPVVIFMGMRSDHETAVFMVSTDVHAQGDGRCVPSKKDCEAVELRRDQVAFLDFAAADGSVTQYELDLVDVALHETTSQAKANAAYARASAAGRRLVRRRAATSAVMSGLRYSQRSGVLAAVAGTYLERDGGTTAVSGDAPQAAAGTAPSAPTLTPLP